MTTENRTFGTAGDPIVSSPTFVERRTANDGSSAPSHERRQFSDGRQNLSPEAAELGRAIDQYKLINRRRYISYEEMLSIIKSIGYQKTGQ